MAIVINGSGTVTGLAVGGLPDGTVDTDTLANTTVTAAKVAADVATQAELDAAGFNPDAAVVFNESGADADFRIEASGQDKAIVVNGATGYVGVNTSGMAETPLHIMKTAAANTIEKLLLLDSNADSHANGKGGSIVWRDISSYADTAELIAARIGGGNASEVEFKLRNTLVFGMTSNGAIYGCDAAGQVQGSGLSIQHNDSSNNAAWIENTATSNHGRVLRLQLTTDYDNNSSYFLYMVAGTEGGGSGDVVRAAIFSDGDMQNHDNSYGSTSDERIKQNITDANSQWADIKALKIRNYKKIDDVNKYGSNAKTQIGLVAQEAELVSPGLIKESDPSVGDIAVNSEFGTLYTADDSETQGDEPTAKVGEVKTINSQVKAIQYSVLYMKAVKALQEAMTRIETLEAKVTALENA